MLPLIALFLRAVIQVAITFGIPEILMNTVVPKVHEAIQAIMVHFGVPEEEAKDILANETLKFVEEVGLGAATLRTKLPLKIAELLGFTTKGWSLRVLASQTAAKAAAASTSITVAAKEGMAKLAGEFGAKAAAKGATTAVGKTIGDFLMSKVGITLGFLYVLGNFLDFAAWPGSAFQNTFQSVFKIFGLNPDSSAPSSKILSKDMWGKLKAMYKELGATGIKNPETGETLPFTDENLMAVADKIAANILAEAGTVKLKDMIAALQGLMVFGNQVTDQKLNTVLQGTTPTPGTGTATQIPQTAKIFTGVVSQGTLGTGNDFVARETDLIESEEELKAAMQNNLAAYVTAIPNKLIYELKIVSTVTTSDGIKRTGSAQKIISGYLKSGQPKYKTVRNKFAILNIYIMADGGRKTKISQIILGPTDAVKLNPTQETLSTTESAVRADLIVSNPGEITGVTKTIGDAVAPQGEIQIAAPKAQEIKQEYEGYIDLLDRTNFKVGSRVILGRRNGIALAYKELERITTNEDGLIILQFGRDVDLTGTNSFQGQGQTIILSPRGKFINWRGAEDNIPTVAGDPSSTIQNYKNWIASGKLPPGTGAPQETTINVQQPKTEIPESTNPAKCQANSLAEFFDPEKIKFPSIDERAKLYEQFGLGPAAWYTGTAEQNTKLLRELKKQSGCVVV